MGANVDEMFSVRKQVWWQGTNEDHGQAHILGDHPSWEDARQLAGLGWDPVEGPLYRPIQIDALRREIAEVMLDAELDARGQIDAVTAAVLKAQPQVDGWKHIGRTDDAAATLACTAESYPLITNSDFGGIFEAVLQQPNVKFETGGSLEGGRKVWMLAVLDEPIELKGDGTVTMPYLAITARHDSQGAVVLRATAVRIVCANTFNASEMEGERSGLTYRFVHHGDWRSRVDEARVAVTGARKEFQAYRELSEELLLVKVTPKQTKQFVTRFFPMPPKGMASDRVMSNVDESRKRFTDILNSETVMGTGIDGTAYGLVQAAGEYLDHARKSRSWETKLNRTLLTSQPLKARALQLVREVAMA